MRLLTKHGLGSSGSMMTFVGSVWNLLDWHSTYKKRWILNNCNYNQFAYIFVGTVSGALLSSNLSGQFNNPEAVRPLDVGRCLLGGMLMMLGARTAGGCTSGHGITGSSELGLQSFAAIAGLECLERVLFLV
mmetsp:Transcript_44290/g.96709  ORF Transcript_44290/g.96709 Transcript_44290/m.96709 type:complete len:132 (-) Transcript_44290:80-475(-)